MNIPLLPLPAGYYGLQFFHSLIGVSGFLFGNLIALIYINLLRREKFDIAKRIEIVLNFLICGLMFALFGIYMIFVLAILYTGHIIWAFLSSFIEIRAH
jgi:hypothetical protein